MVRRATPAAPSRGWRGRTGPPGEPGGGVLTARGRGLSEECGKGWRAQGRGSILEVDREPRPRFVRAMRKPVMLCYGVPKNRQPFDPDWASIKAPGHHATW